MMRPSVFKPTHMGTDDAGITTLNFGNYTPFSSIIHLYNTRPRPMWNVSDSPFITQQHLGSSEQCDTPK